VEPRRDAPPSTDAGPGRPLPIGGGIDVLQEEGSFVAQEIVAPEVEEHPPACPRLEAELGPALAGEGDVGPEGEARGDPDAERPGMRGIHHPREANVPPQGSD